MKLSKFLLNFQFLERTYQWNSILTRYKMEPFPWIASVEPLKMSFLEMRSQEKSS